MQIAHVLDKAAENVLGFISVLPGAFSAYRFKAIIEPDVRTGESPLNKYFAGLNSQNLGPFMANIYLAEDRILCFELMARNGTAYTLSYVPGAVAVTDVPLNCADLLKQRKRWLNGALFALFYVFMHANQFYSSGLSVFRKMTVTVEIIVLTILTVLNLTGPGIFYTIFRMVCLDVLNNRSDDIGLGAGIAQQFANILNFSLVFVLFIQVVFGLGNSQPTHIKSFYTMSLLYFAFFQLILITFGLYFVFTSKDVMVWVAFGILFGMYPVGGFLHKPSDAMVITGALPFYLLLVPLFIIILPIRAFSNIHDISWGTKGLEAATNDSRKESFQRFRSIYLLGWMAYNVAFAGIVLQLHGAFDGFADGFLKFLFVLAGGINVFRMGCLILLKVQSCLCLGTAIARDMRNAPNFDSAGVWVATQDSSDDDDDRQSGGPKGLPQSSPSSTLEHIGPSLLDTLPLKAGSSVQRKGTVASTGGPSSG